MVSASPDFVGMATHAHVRAAALSFGQQKLVELAQILMLEPKLIMLDEPAGGINPTLIERMAEKIRELNGMGTTFLIVEHNMPLVAELCDPVIVLARGTRIDECGEAIAHARHGLDVLLARGFLPQRLPQHRHVVIQVVFLDRRPGPHGVEQFLLGDQLAGVLDQHAERIEHFETQGNGDGVARQPPFTQVELKRPESIRAPAPVLGHESHLRKVSGMFQRS